MKAISQLIQQPKQPSNEQEDDNWITVKSFTKRINQDRVADGSIKKYGKAKDRMVAIRLAQAGLKAEDFHFFFNKCKDSRNFSELFFGLTKTKPVEN